MNSYKKGVSLVSITVSIVVMFVILSTLSISITFSINNAKKLAFAEEIYNIQSIVTEYIQKEGALPNSTEVITIEATDISQFEEESIESDSIVLNVLELTKLDIKNTNYGNKSMGNTEVEKEKDIYAVSQETGKVYYIAGFESGNTTYYTLTEELLQMVEKEQGVGVDTTLIGESTITFKPNKIGWTNEAISVKVSVPAEYTSPSITVNNANIAYTTSVTADDIIYNVNTTNVKENYIITVNYIKNGIEGTATYTTKLDTIAPVISKDTSILNTETLIKGLNAADEGSGIKYFRYAEGVIDGKNVAAYMNAYGKNIRSGNIKFVIKKPCTIYAEDKAGNYSLMYMDELGNLTNTKLEEYN